MPRPKKKTPHRGRTRPHKLQVWLSADEDAVIEWMLSHYECTRAELVRTWIKNASTQYRSRHASKEAPPPDPRQLTIGAPHA